jgi:hypothetical protein
VACTGDAACKSGVCCGASMCMLTGVAEKC